MPLPLRAAWMSLLLVAGGWASGAEKVALQLNWRHQFQFAGYYAAQEKGYYREAGLEVALREAGPDTDPVEEVTAGRAQYGVGRSSLVLYRQHGWPVVVLAVVFQHSPMVLVARADRGIGSVHDLAGRRVMLETHAEELVAYLNLEGVARDRLTVLPHSQDIHDLLEGRVDAASAYSTDELFLLERGGGQWITFRPRTGGIDFYGDNLFTSEAELRAHPARARAFREASLRGWRYAMAHPEEMVDLILARHGSRHDREHLRYEARQMASLVQPTLVDMGYMYRGRWQHIADTYQALGLLPSGRGLDGFLYDPAQELGRRQRRLARGRGAAVATATLLGALSLLLLTLWRQLRRENEARARMTDELAGRERMFRFLAEKSVDVIWTLDVATARFTYMSPSIQALRGFTPEEAMGQTLDQALTPESLPRALEALAQAREAWARGEGEARERVLELDQPHRDGHVVPTEVVTSLHGEPGGPLAMVLGVSRNIAARRRREAEMQDSLTRMEHIAGTDPLTGAWNRRRFHETVDAERQRARRTGQLLSLLMMDVDHFKPVNDLYGHAVGDAVLAEVARRVLEVVRRSDGLTRWGGEEFVVLLPQTGLTGAVQMAERIRARMASQPFEGVGRVTVSLGVAQEEAGERLEAWIGRADQALYRAKAMGRDRVEADPGTETAE